MTTIKTSSSTYVTPRAVIVELGESQWRCDDAIITVAEDTITIKSAG